MSVYLVDAASIVQNDLLEGHVTPEADVLGRLEQSTHVAGAFGDLLQTRSAISRSW